MPTEKEFDTLQSQVLDLADLAELSSKLQKEMAIKMTKLEDKIKQLEMKLMLDNIGNIN